MTLLGVFPSTRRLKSAFNIESDSWSTGSGTQPYLSYFHTSSPAYDQPPELVNMAKYRASCGSFGSGLTSGWNDVQRRYQARIEVAV